MNDYVSLSTNDDHQQITVHFEIEHAKVMTIGEKLGTINDEAYMNGYNWDILVTDYINRKRPKALEGSESDPEAGTCAFFYPLTSEHRENAESLKSLIVEMIESESNLISYVKTYGSSIEWD